MPINGTCLITPTTDLLITIIGSFRPAPAGTPAVPNPTVPNPSPTVPTQVLGAKLGRPQALPVTGPTNLGLLGVLAMLCYLLGGVALSIGGVALSRCRKHRPAPFMPGLHSLRPRPVPDEPVSRKETQP